MKIPLSLLLVILAGCSSKIIPTTFPAPIPLLETMPVYEEKGAVKVGVDPYWEPYRQRDIFLAHFNQIGVLAIQVLIQNGESGDIRFQRADLRLQLPNDSLIPPALKRDVVNRVTLKQPARELETYRKPYYVVEDYRSKELKDQILKKGESIHGFVYFILPEGLKNIEKANVIIPLVDIEYSRRITFHVFVHDSSF